MAVTIKGFASDWSVPPGARAKLDELYVPLDGAAQPETLTGTWLGALIAAANDGDVIDLHGKDITISQVIHISKRLTLRNGTLRRESSRVLLVNAAGVTMDRMKFIRTGTTSTDGGAAVFVQKENFQSVDCHYSSEAGSALSFQHGTCNGAHIKGGTATTYARKQNAAGIYVAAGSVGNYGITIEDVAVIGGPDRGPDGILVFDAYGSTIRGCKVRDLHALPEVTIPATWTGLGSGVYESETVREDGPTRVITVNDSELTEHTSQATIQSPPANQWSISGGKVYLNLGGTDPNTRTVVSRIVSGYGITMYCTGGTWRTMSHNRVEGNRVENVDGFGIYLQLGDTTSVGNSSEGNVLLNTCRAGVQSNKLPFAGFGVVGGRHTVLVNDVIDGCGTSASRTPGFKHNESFDDNSTGAIIGMRVFRASSSGIIINGGIYQLTNCHVANCEQNGYGFFPDKNTTTLRAHMTACEAVDNAGHGVSASSTQTPGANLHLTVQGGYIHGSGRGIQLSEVDTANIGGGLVIDGTTGWAMNIASGNSVVHLDGITFHNTNGVAVDNSVRTITAGRLLWGINVGTKITGTGAARVRDAFETLMGGVVTLPDAPTVPAVNPSSGGVLYTEGGALKFRGSAGTVTTIGPA